MATRLVRLSAAGATLLAACLLQVGARDDECETMAIADQAKHSSDRSLMQLPRSPSSIKANHSETLLTGRADDVSWTTNMGQKHHSCKGSRFEVDFTGTHKGLVVKNGMLLAKGECPQKATSIVDYTGKPSLSQSLVCEANATGCHMWCAPVWQSYYDSTDWSAFDSRCNSWNGHFKDSDSTCSKTGRLFTWARTVAPDTKNVLELTFAIAESCKHWCSPLWVTLYDPSNWAKSFRWCFNRHGDFGVCDRTEDVPVNSWETRRFPFHEFLQKHGYDADDYAVELAVYSEFDKAEVLVNDMTFLHVSEKATTTSAPPGQHSHSIKKCGSQSSCGGEEQCCRRGGSAVDAKCCPSTWQCCEDSCCPAGFTCTITQFGHTCAPPKHEVQRKPDLCNM